MDHFVIVFIASDTIVFCSGVLVFNMVAQTEQMFSAVVRWSLLWLRRLSGDVFCHNICHFSSLCYVVLACLKHPSLFAALLFWTYHNKSHNMNALVILSHSWSPFFSHLLVYMEKISFCGSLCSLLEYFREKKTRSRLPMQITWPWPLVGRFSHGLITIRQKKMII